MIKTQPSVVQKRMSIVIKTQLSVVKHLINPSSCRALPARLMTELPSNVSLIITVKCVPNKCVKMRF